MEFNHPLFEQIASVPFNPDHTHPLATQKNLVAFLRDLAVWLADNPGESELIDPLMSDYSPEESFRGKMTPAYIRSTMGRVRQVREVGRISISKTTITRTVPSPNGDIEIEQPMLEARVIEGEFSSNKSISRADAKRTRKAVLKTLQSLSGIVFDIGPLCRGMTPECKAVAIDVAEACREQLLAVINKSVEEAAE